MSVQVYDGVITPEILNSCITEAEQSAHYSVLHRAGDGSYGFKYHWLFASSNKIEEFTNKHLQALWEEIKQHLPKNIYLHRGYINAHTYGVEDAIHIDDPEIQNGLTVIVYLCSGWYPEWFGQTMFFETVNKQNNEIIQSVLPKYNRFIVFNKDIPHCVSPLSRKFIGIRLTCMFKVGLHNDPT